VLSVFKYNIGRLFSYSFLGLIVGLFGFSVLLFSTMQWLSIACGILIIGMAWSNQVENWPIIGVWTKKMTSLIQLIFLKTKELPLAYRSFSFGMANGLLPCGMVYLGLSNALGSGSLITSILSMSTFGLGTLPAMFFMPMIAQSKWRVRIPKIIIALLLTLIGTLTILRGLNLGIPYLSPKTHIHLNESHTSPSIECCEDTCR
jgi:sulfite exporter TauE/SafE